jgi:hypothetical protein
MVTILSATKCNWFRQHNIMGAPLSFLLLHNRTVLWVQIEVFAKVCLEGSRLAGKSVHALVEAGLVKSIPDLYTMIEVCAPHGCRDSLFQLTRSAFFTIGITFSKVPATFCLKEVNYL